VICLCAEVWFVWGEICKNGTANIGLCSFAIGPTFHRHRWSHRVIHWEWQIHEWSVFAVLILQFFQKGTTTPGEARSDLLVLRTARRPFSVSPWLLPPWLISQRATAKGARPGRPQLLWDARPPNGMPRSHQSNGLDTGTPQKNELLLAAGQMTFRV